MARFGVGKILDVGSDDPIVARILLQFDDILESNTVDVPEESVARVRKYLFKCMLDLLDVREAVAAYIGHEDSAIADAAASLGSSRGDDTYRFDDPTESLAAFFTKFLIRAVMVERDVKHIGNSVLGTSCKYVKDLRTEVAKLVPEDDPRSARMQADKEWLDRLYDLRGKAEHEELDMLRFDVAFAEGLEPVVHTPSFSDDGLAIRDYITRTFSRLFLFAEDTIAILLDLKSRWCRIVAVSDDRKQSSNGFRYVVGLNAPSAGHWALVDEGFPYAQLRAPESDAKESIQRMIAYGKGHAVVTDQRIFLVTEREMKHEGGFLDVF